MSFPDSLPTKLVMGRFVTYPDGKPAQGSVRFVLNDFMKSTTENVFVVPFDITIQLDRNGSIAVELPTTDAPGWTASSYKVVVSTISRIHQGLFDPIKDKVQTEIRTVMSVPVAGTGPIDLADVLTIPS